MLPGWHQNLEGLEAISQDDMMRDLVLRMSALSQSGNLAPFLIELAHDGDLDDATKITVQEIAADPAFLLAVEDYLRRTRIVH